MSTYLFRPVFDHQIEFQDNAPIAWDYSRRSIKNNDSHVEIEPLQSYTERIVDVDLRLYTRADIKGFRDFQATCKGRLTGFWFPILTQAAFNISAGDDATNFDVKEGRHTENFSRLSELHLIFKKDGESDQYAKVSGIADNGNGTEKVTISSSASPAIDETWYAFQLIYARFDTDEIKFQFPNEGHAQISFSVRELPKEYATAETGESPVYLYHFQSTLSGETIHWRATSYFEDVVSNSETFSARNISHGAISQMLEFGRGGDVSIKDIFGSDTPWPLFIPYSSRAEVSLDIYEATLDDLDTVTNIFSGVIQSVQVQGKKVEAKARDVLAGLPGRYPGWMIEPRCPWKFGETNTCKKDVSGLVKTVTFTAIADNVVSVSGTFTGLGENYFAYGFLETGSNEEREIRSIIQSSLPATGVVQLILSAPLKFAATSDSADITPGCGGAYSECVGYSNVANFGGVKYVPGNNLSVKAVEIETANGNKK